MTHEEVLARKAAGKVFIGDPRVLLQGLWARQKVDWFNHSWPINALKRLLLPKAIFRRFGRMSWIEPPVHVSLGKNTSIGDYCYLNFNSVLLDDWTITIGDHVLFGPNVTVLTVEHPLHVSQRCHGESYAAPVVIRDGVWVASGATILPGVTIGENSVIGAGSVVTRDIPANVLAMGTPCRVVREIGEADRIDLDEFVFSRGRGAGRGGDSAGA